MLKPSQSSFRRRLSSAGRRVTDAISVRAAVGIVERLPLRQAAAVIDAVQLQGKLDYRPSRVRMVVRSPYHYARLSSCAKEPETVRWIEREVRPGDVLYDVGANVGAYSLVAHAATKGECHVYAFEPSFSTFATLCENIKLNKAGSSVTPFQVALSDVTAMRPFNYSSTQSGAALHTSGAAIDYRGKRFEPQFVLPIMTYRLDDLIDQFSLAPPTHLKIDVDGIELDVLRGAERSLQSVRSILLEAGEESANHRAIVAFLASMGFDAHSMSRVITKGFANFVFVRK